MPPIETTIEAPTQPVLERVALDVPAATPAAAPIQRPRPSTVSVVPPELRSRWATPRFGAMTPEDLATILRQADQGYPERWANLCEYLVEDPDLFGIVQTRYGAVSGAQWEIEPGYSSDPVAQRWAAPAAEFCRKALEQLPDIERNDADALDGIGVGWSVQELMWKRDSNAWIVGEVEWTRAARYRFDDDWRPRLYDGGMRGFPGQELPAGKFLVHVPRTRAAYPVKTGELRVIAWYWLFHRWCVKYWLAAAERHGAPFLWARVAEGARGDTKERARDVLERMRNDGVAVIEGVESSINMIEASLSGADVFDALCARFERGYAKAFLGATLTVDVGDSGSRALGTEHNKVRVERSKRDARVLASSWKRDVLYWLCFYNQHLFGGVMPPVPTRRFAIDAGESIPDIAVTKGAITYNELREQSGLPKWSAEQGGDDRIPADAGGGPVPSAPLAPPAAPAAPPTQPAPTGGATPGPFAPAPSAPAQGSPSTAASESASSARLSPTTSLSPSTPTSSRSRRSPLARALLGE